MYLGGGGYHFYMTFISKYVNKYLMGVPHEVNIIAWHQESGLVVLLEAKVPLVPDQGLVKELVFREVR